MQKGTKDNPWQLKAAEYAIVCGRYKGLLIRGGIKPSAMSISSNNL